MHTTRLAVSFLLILACLASVTGCRREAAVGPLTIEQWMHDDPDSCMWYYTGLYVPLAGQQRYDSLEHIYARILRAMPDPVPGDPDSLAYIAGWVATFYYNARMLQDKMEGGSRLTDSLAASPNPFYARTLQPELLSVTAKFYVLEGRTDRVDSLGRVFEQLPSTGNPKRDIRAWHDMAWAIEYCDLGTERAIALQQHAVKMFRQGPRGNGDWEVLSQLGRLYHKNGDFMPATELIQEAIDSMAAHPATPGDGLINAYNDLSDLYLTLGLYDKALEANSQAITQSHRTDGWMLDEVYSRRADCYYEAGRSDSALAWMAEAEKALPDDAEASLRLPMQVERLKYYMAHRPDSAGRCLEACRLLLPDTAWMEPEWKMALLALYGQALLQTPGRADEGLAYLERSYNTFASAGRPAEAVRLGEQIVRGYVDRGIEERLASFYPAYAALRDSVSAERSRHAAIGANIRYETRRKEQENRTLAAEVKLKEEKLVNNRLTFATIGTLLVLAVALALTYIVWMKRYYHLLGEMRLMRINSLLEEQMRLQERNDALTHDLEEAMQRQAAAEIEAERARISEQKQGVEEALRAKEGELRASVGSVVLNSTEVARFRRSFLAVYPHYLADLHRLCPNLTPTDELIAMLLRLGLSNNDIALVLNVTKASVNKARTRMRRRLGLAETGLVLEEFLLKVGENVYSKI